MPETSHVYRGSSGEESGRPLVLLHGSDGSEVDLLPLASELAPKAPKLSIRGNVATEGGNAFIRRFRDRRVDEADLSARATLLADFIEAACVRHGLDEHPVAVGYSGAIMAAALLLSRPRLLAAAILLRPLSPFTRDLPHRLNGTPVLIIDGVDDRRRESGDGGRLAERLVRAGARVTHHVLPVGHAYTPKDSQLAKEWLGAIAR